jgi:regulator of nonsense transcripts 2
LSPEARISDIVICTAPGADDSGDDSGDEAERREEERDEEEEDELGSQDSPVCIWHPLWSYCGSCHLQTEDRAPSPDQEVVLSASNSLQESLGPSDEAEAEFAKELAKLVTDTSAESRKVDKKTALALWDVLPPNIRKKRADEPDEDGDGSEVVGQDIMSFTVITRRGNKQHVHRVTFFWFTPLTMFPDSSVGCTFWFSPCCTHSLGPVTRQRRTARVKTSGT